MSWAASPNELKPSGPPAPRVRSASAIVSVIGAAVIWIALLGPVIALLTHLSWSALWSSLTAPGAFGPLLTSVESGVITLTALFCLCTPLAWMLAHGRLPVPRV